MGDRTVWNSRSISLEATRSGGGGGAVGSRLVLVEIWRFLTGAASLAGVRFVLACMRTSSAATRLPILGARWDMVVVVVEFCGVVVEVVVRW